MDRILADMNAKAVFLFEMGNNDDAVSVLRDAVSLLVQSRHRALTPTLDNHEPPDGDGAELSAKMMSMSSSCSCISPTTNFVILPRCHRSALPSPSAATGAGGEQESIIDYNDVDFFPHPFLFELRSNPPRLDTKTTGGGKNTNHHLTHDEFALATAVCFYNMALVHHRTWVSRRKNDDDLSLLLQRVLCLYQQAFQVLLSWNPKTATGRGNVVLVIMALCKNLSSVSYEYGNLAQVKVYKTHLEQAMRFVDPHLLDRETYSFFRISIMLRGTEIIAAKAA